MTARLNDCDFFVLDDEYNKLKKNTPFLLHIIDCLEGRKSKSVVKKTIEQLHKMVIDRNNKIKLREENCRL